VRFNKLLRAIRKTFSDLVSALSGETNFSIEMEVILAKIKINQIPDLFIKLGYPSLKPLNSWLQDLKLRVKFYEEWIKE